MSPSTVITIMGLLLHSFYFDDSPSSSWLSETPVAESKITIDFLKHFMSASCRTELPLAFHQCNLSLVISRNSPELKEGTVEVQGGKWK